MMRSAMWRAAKTLATRSYVREASYHLVKRSIAHTTCRCWPNSQAVSTATSATSDAASGAQLDIIIAQLP